MAVYMYVVARDFGFAPNPFHGFCTLATCKPVVRRVAGEGDWIIGMGGQKLKAEGKCIYAMRVTETMSFDDYWSDARFLDKRPVRNGSRRMMLGDNIYHREDGLWQQLDSHHSLPDGSPDISNVNNDTQTDRVLISERFVYFGESAPTVPPKILNKLGYFNRRNHLKFLEDECRELLDWLHKNYSDRMNTVIGDPYQFKNSASRYSAGKDKVIA